jgi:DNA-binding transcriptional regulator YiaG
MINVKVERAKLNLTQTQFAKAIGVSQQLVSKWEKGTKMSKTQEFAIRWFLHKRKARQSDVS